MLSISFKLRAAFTAVVALWLGSNAEAAGQAPTVVSLTPPIAAGTRQALSVTFSDADGYSDLRTINIVIGRFASLHGRADAPFRSGRQDSSNFIEPPVNGRNACYISFHVPDMSVSLMDDAGSRMLPGMRLNSAGSLSNSQCSVVTAESRAVGAGDSLTLTVSLEFSPTGFSGNHAVYVSARDTSNASTGWKSMGVLAAQSTGPVRYPAPVSVSPSTVLALESPLELLYRDESTFHNLSTVELLIRSARSVTCHVRVVPTGPSSASVTVIDYQRDRTATSQTIAIPGTDILKTRTCTVDAGNSSISGSGTDLKLFLNLSLPNEPIGPNIIWLAAETARATSGWQALGTIGAEDFYVLSTSLSDPHVLHKRLVGGGSVDYYATKDSNGFTTGLYAALITDARGRVTSWAFDAGGRPTKISGPDGITLDFQWQTPDRAEITAASADGSIWVRFPYTFVADGNSSNAAARASLSSPNPLSGSDSEVKVTVSGCSPAEPIDSASVYLQYQQLGGPASVLPARHVGRGEYIAMVPGPETALLQNLVVIGESVESAIKSTCDFLKQKKMIISDPALNVGLCTAAVGALTLFSPAIGVTLGDKLLGSCVGMIKTSDTLCKVGRTTWAGTTSWLLKKLIEEASSAPVRLQAFAVVDDVARGSFVRTGLPPKGPFFPFDISGFPVASNITLTPRSATTYTGSTLQLTPSATNACNAAVVIPATRWSWSSSDVAIATVVSGTVTALKEGVVAIRVTDRQSQRAASAEVKIGALAVIGTGVLTTVTTYLSDAGCQVSTIPPETRTSTYVWPGRLKELINMRGQWLPATSSYPISGTNSQGAYSGNVTETLSEIGVVMYEARYTVVSGAGWPISYTWLMTLDLNTGRLQGTLTANFTNPCGISTTRVAYAAQFPVSLNR